MNLSQAIETTATARAEHTPSTLWQLVRSCLRLERPALVVWWRGWRWKKTPEPFIVPEAAVIGLIVSSALHH